MSKVVSLVRRDGPWGWDAAGARYLCADGGEAGAPDPEVMAFLHTRLSALCAPVVEAEADRIALVFQDQETAAKAQEALTGHLLLVVGPEGDRMCLSPGAGFSRQNAALMVEMISEVMLDLSPAGPMW